MNKLQPYLDEYNLVIDNSTTLVGYDTKNYKITDSKGQNYVLKLDEYTPSQWNDLRKENEILLSLKDQLDFTTLYPIVNAEGNHIFKKDNKIFRLLSFVHGEFWGDNPLNNAQLVSHGTAMANLTLRLQEIEPDSMALRTLDWDLSNLMNNLPLLEYVTNPEEKKYMRYYFDQFQHFVLPKLPTLRKSLIHNDFNSWNTLFNETELIGLIDFGDMVYSCLIHDLAVSLSYIFSYSEDILTDLSLVLSAYHKIIPLQKEELDVLYQLIAGRIITSLVNSAKGLHEEPENTYIPISAKPYRQLLHRWIAMNPIAFKNAAYAACGYSSDSTQASKEKMTSSRAKHFTSGLALSYNDPIHLSSSAFQYMHDMDGNTYLDAYNNIPLVGHAHPRISQVISKQARSLNTNTRYHYAQLGEYAEHLLSYFPKHLSKVFFVNSGSAASDLAIRMAQSHTQQKNMFVLEDGYHGNTQIGIDISHYKHANKGGSGKGEYIHHFPLPKTFGSIKSSETFALEAIQQIDALHAQDISPAAFIAEPISGCGGQVPLAEGYLTKVYEKIRSLNGLCISDEVQTGFGRLGSWFWGFEMHEVQPDLVILGKPIGNGHPIGAVVCTEEVAESFNNGMEFFSSFGGNPVSCAVGNEVLNILESENLQARAKAVGDYWKKELGKLQKEFPCLADIRGEGLFLGIEIIQDELPGTKLAKQLKNKMKEKFVLTGTDGRHDNVIKVKPPLCFNEKNVDEFCKKLHQSCTDIFKTS